MLSDLATLAVLCRSSSETKGERMPLSLLLQLRSFWLPKLRQTVKLKSDLEQNRQLPHPATLLHRHQDRLREQHDTNMTSSGKNLENTFKDAINAHQSETHSSPRTDSIILRKTGQSPVQTPLSTQRDGSAVDEIVESAARKRCAVVVASFLPHYLLQSQQA